MSNLNLNTISSLDTGREVDVNRVMQTVDYVGGLVIDSLDTVIVDGDDRYVLAASAALPYTTTGAGMPEGGAFVSVGDTVLRQELVQPVATFDSVADMVNATGLTIGRKVRTLGYYTPGDGGGNDYEIVAAGTGTADGGSFIDLSGSGLQAKGLFVLSLKVEQFGARGVGSDDTPYVQSAIDYNENVTFTAARSYKLSGLQLADRDTNLRFNGAQIIIDGGDGILFAPDSIISEYTATYQISGARFLFKTNHSAIRAHQTWQSGARQPHRIFKNEFYADWGGAHNTNIDAMISLQGLTSCVINENTFIGTPNRLTNNIYGIRSSYTNDFESSVMNIHIADNHFARIGFPVWFGDRAINEGGRHEGISVIDNNMILSRTCVRIKRGLSDRVNGNLFSQCFTGINTSSSFGDYGDNVYEGIYSEGIHIDVEPEQFCEHTSFKGSIIKLSPADESNSATCAIRITSTRQEGARILDFNGVIAHDSKKDQSRNGVVFEGNYTHQQILFNGATFTYFLNAFHATEGQINGFFDHYYSLLTTNKFSDKSLFRELGSGRLLRTIRGIFGATPPIAEADLIVCNDDTTITGLSGSPDDGRTVVIINKSSNPKTIQHSGGFVLNGGTNLTLPIDQSITMVRVATQWLQI